MTFLHKLDFTLSMYSKRGRVISFGLKYFIFRFVVTDRNKVFLGRKIHIHKRFREDGVS